MSPVESPGLIDEGRVAHSSPVLAWAGMSAGEQTILRECHVSVATYAGPQRLRPALATRPRPPDLLCPAPGSRPAFVRVSRESPGSCSPKDGSSLAPPFPPTPPVAPGVQFFLTMTCQSKRCVMMSLIRISRAIHNRQQSHGRATFCSTQFPQTPSVPSVRRSRSSNCFTV